MLRIAIICLGIFMISTVAFSQTQSELNDEASGAYKQADQKLNEVYQKILKLYSKNALFIKNMKAAQKLWIQFRDAQLAMLYPERSQGYYGSDLPLCQENYLAQLTNARVKELEEWLKPPSEGDVCSGTIGEFEFTDDK